jgi:hypothetical protein
VPVGRGVPVGATELVGVGDTELVGVAFAVGVGVGVGDGVRVARIVGLGEAVWCGLVGAAVRELEWCTAGFVPGAGGLTSR